MYKRQNYSYLYHSDNKSQLIIYAAAEAKSKHHYGVYVTDFGRKVADNTQSASHDSSGKI